MDSNTTMDDNLFNQKYTLGNLNEIRFIADVIGRISVIIISIVGFGIVMSTIFKNSIHGLYAVSPKFWDRVDEAKKASLGFGSAEGGHQVSKIVGSVTIVLLNCCPNIKALTEFDDEILDAKAYFMKALPLACVQIFIGVFIFFGYPAKVAEKFGEFGTGLFDVVLMNVDPVAWVDAIPEKMIRLDLSTNGSKDDFDKAVNKIAKSVYNSYVGELSDMTAEKRNEVSRQIEQWIIDELNEKKEYTNSDAYKLSVNSRITIAKPATSKIDGQKGKDGTFTIAKYKSLDTWKHGSAMDTKGKYIRFDALFTPVAQKGVLANVKCKMTAGSAVADTSKNQFTIKMKKTGDGKGRLTIGGGAAFGKADIGEDKPLAVQIKVSGDTLIISPKTTTTKIKGKKINSISGIDVLQYSAEGMLSNVTDITCKNGTATPTFSPTSTKSGYSSWSYGEEPKKTNK